MTFIKSSSKILLFVSIVLLNLGAGVASGQNTGNFPFDPYVILKSWNYDYLVKNMGEGEQVIGTMRNQKYLAGLKYPFDLLGMKGTMEFTFSKDSISRFQFRKEHILRVIEPELIDRMARDTNVSKAYNIEIRQLDSLRRDSLINDISEILGTPLSNGPTAVTEKNARHLAIWISRGYSCMFKDYISYSEITFSLSTIPLWVVGEFDIPAGTEICRKTMINTKKFSWTANLLGYPSEGRELTYADVFLLLEYSTGQKYLESLPKVPVDYLQTLTFVPFATGQRCLLNLPKNAIGYLPDITFEDCNGDAIPEAWIKVPVNSSANCFRHYLFSLQYREPNLIFNSADQMPKSIGIKSGTPIQITMPDGTVRTVESDLTSGFPSQFTQIKIKGFKYLKSNELNSDGSANLSGGIELRLFPGAPVLGILEIMYKHVPGGWEVDQFKLLK